MCGILGKINFNGNEVDKNILISASELIRSRGPDDSGVWSEAGCGLAHRRLSVIDITPAGHQPMTSANERYVCVYNGEIYNFQKLKSKLSSLGVIFRGNCDTEVLLEGWSKWGTGLFDNLDGMFSFAIWDRKLRKLTVARDRMGEKPLYYHHSGKQFIFSSRPRPIFKLEPSLTSEYDEQALRLYLGGGYIPAPYSAHKALRKLQAAHYLEVTESDISIKRYWDFSNIETEWKWQKRSENDLLDELDDIIEKSVKQQMVSDVPIGAFLSGGIDSSLVTAMMSKHSSSPVKTFTIGFEEKSYDESSDAQMNAGYLKTDHYCEHLTSNDLLKLLPDFFEHYDEPFYDVAAFPVMALSRLARKHVTVSLTGDGGDELFGGYRYYQFARYLHPLDSLPNWVKRGSSSLIKLIPGHRSQLLSAVLMESSSIRKFAFLRGLTKDFQEIMPSELLARTDSLEDLFEKSSLFFPKDIHPSEEGMRLDSLYILSDDYLQKTDVASMAFSLECRAPLLGREVVEWAMKLPVNWKVKGIANKYLLRRLAYRYVPEDILDRPKRGFEVPIDSWLRVSLKEWAYEKFNNSEYYEGLPLKQDAVLELFKLHGSGTRNVSHLLWAILMLLEFNSKLKENRQADR